MQEEKVLRLAKITENSPLLKTLKIISLYGNMFLNLVGWVCVFECLIHCTSLTKIDLSFCFLTNEKIIAISKMLSK